MVAGGNLSAVMNWAAGSVFTPPCPHSPHLQLRLLHPKQLGEKGARRRAEGGEMSLGLRVKADRKQELQILAAEPSGIQETRGRIPDFLLDLGEGA